MKWVWRVLIAALALAAIGGLTFYLRPVSCFNAWLYLQEDFAGMESHTVRVDGYRVHYLAEGPKNGPVVVLVHGLGGRADDWWNLAPYLVRAGFRVYMPDLPGFGRSQQPRNFSYSIRDQAGVVVGFMDALGLKQVELGGWSMGGWVAQVVAIEHPERVSRLMIIDSVGLDVKPTWNTALFTPTSPRQLAELDALLMPNPPPIPAFITRDILRNSRKNAWVIQRAIAAMFTGQDVTDRELPDLKMPVEIAWGAVDQIVPLSQAQTMHALIPQSELDVFAGCGHLAPMQCSGEMGPKVAQFAGQ